MKQRTQIHRISERHDNGRYINCFRNMGVILVLGFIFLLFFGADKVSAFRKLSDNELSSVTGTGPVDLSFDQNSIRIFLDMQVKTYTEIDSLKLGYYQKNPEFLETRKYLEPGQTAFGRIHTRDPQIESVDFDNATFTLKGDDATYPLYTMEAYNPYNPNAVAENDIQTLYAAFKDDSKHMYYWKNILECMDNDPKLKNLMKLDPLGIGRQVIEGIADTLGLKEGYLEGPQTLDGKMLLPLKDGATTPPSPNENTLDWDINWKNVRMGNSPDDPFVMNGLVIRLQYDDVNSPNKKLTGLVVGTNNAVGDVYADMIRTTGIFNPKLANNKPRALLHQATIPDLLPIINLDGAQLINFIEEFNEKPIPVMVQRDSFFWHLNQFRFDNEDPNDGSAGPYNPQHISPHPNDPTYNPDHRGLFLRVGFDPRDPHFGYQFIGGYEESIASTFSYSGAHLGENLQRQEWWDKL